MKNKKFNKNQIYSRVHGGSAYGAGSIASGAGQNSPIPLEIEVFIK